MPPTKAKKRLHFRPTMHQFCTTTCLATPLYLEPDTSFHNIHAYYITALCTKLQADSWSKHLHDNQLQVRDPPGQCTVTNRYLTI